MFILFRLFGYAVGLKRGEVANLVSLFVDDLDLNLQDNINSGQNMILLTDLFTAIRGVGWLYVYTAKNTRYNGISKERCIKRKQNILLKTI